MGSRVIELELMVDSENDVLEGQDGRVVGEGNGKRVKVAWLLEEKVKSRSTIRTRVRAMLISVEGYSRMMK